MKTDTVTALRHVGARILQVGVAVSFGLIAAGCGTTAPSLFPSEGATAPLAGDAAAASQQVRVAIAPVIGPPETITKDFQAQLTSALQKRQIGVSASTAEPARYTLRGYIVSAQERAGTKVSYIWDVTDAAGARVHRITGEEVAAAATGRDPWSAVSGQIVATIADKTAGQLANWIPTQGGAAAPAIAGTPATTGPGGTAPPSTNAIAAPAAGMVPPGSPSGGSATTTGSIERNAAVSAVVSGVKGAPGDGSVSLAGALQKELVRNGVQVSDTGSTSAYRIDGRVKVGPGVGGKQPIQIDWDVISREGTKVGTVSQKNDIPQGSLDGAWGKTADAAAAAAAQGIIKLLKPGGQQQAARAN
ncbi:MAG: hypothetical protein NW205_13170 [Hyphomicrobiaceae bacterium]|nr:hypothetical protein [Hyphomicrobiaceae bacterium]